MSTCRNTSPLLARKSPHAHLYIATVCALVCKVNKQHSHALVLTANPSSTFASAPMLEKEAPLSLHTTSGKPEIYH
eukprot:scaffold35688_cov24-Tisochrysis_lutea.AAC.1